MRTMQATLYYFLATIHKVHILKLKLTVKALSMLANYLYFFVSMGQVTNFEVVYRRRSHQRFAMPFFKRERIVSDLILRPSCSCKLSLIKSKRKATTDMACCCQKTLLHITSYIITYSSIIIFFFLLLF